MNDKLFNVLDTYIFSMVRKLRGKFRTGSVATAQSRILEELESEPVPEPEPELTPKPIIDPELENKIRELRKVARQDEAEAPFLKRLYIDGECYKRVFKDLFEEPENWIYSLGLCYLKAGDYSRAIKCLEKSDTWVGTCLKACLQGDVKEQWALGQSLLYAHNIEQDIVEGNKWCYRAAIGGLAKAQTFIGECFLFGWFMPKDHMEAIKWMKKAAEQGDSQAKRYYDDIYDYIASMNYSKDAFEWMRQEGEKGVAGAQYGLGIYYRAGRAVEKDEKEAVRWWMKAAEVGYAQAQDKIGYCYMNGYILEQDYPKAAHWYKLASEQGWETQNYAKLKEMGYA